MALQYFVLNDWLFKNDKFIELSQQLKLEDVESFSFEEAFSYDIIQYLRNALIGVKKYLLGDKEENLPRNRVVYQRLKLLDQFVKMIPYLAAFYYIFIKYDSVNVCRSYLYK